MNTWKTADAVVWRLEAAIPEQGSSLYVSLVDGRRFVVDAPLEGDVRITPGVRTHEGGLEAELRVRDDVGGWAR